LDGQLTNKRGAANMEDEDVPQPHHLSLTATQGLPIGSNGGPVISKRGAANI